MKRKPARPVPIIRRPAAGAFSLRGNPAVMGWSVLYSPGSSATQLGAADLTTVQNAVDAAATGATIRLPLNGSATWGATLSVTKAITLDGNGCNITKGFSSTSPLLALSTSAASSARVTGFNFKFGSAISGYNQPYYMTIAGGWGNPKFRVDHCTFESCGGSDSTHIRINDALGLIDNNTFYTTEGGEIIHLEAYGNGSGSGWTYSVTPGSDDAVYVEDNSFYNSTSGNPAYFWGASAVQAYYGARWVFRKNFCRMCQVDNHGTAGMVGGRWFEIYQNTFDVVLNGNQSSYIALRAGSGVVFGNLKTGSANSGAGNINIYEEDSGTWPVSYQVGSGYDGGTDGHANCGTRNQSPVYVWGNDFGAGIDGGLVQSDRDVFTSTTQPEPMYRGQLSTDTCGTTYSYVAYIYPHPLQGA